MFLVLYQKKNKNTSMHLVSGKVKDKNILMHEFNFKVLRSELPKS